MAGAGIPSSGLSSLSFFRVTYWPVSLLRACSTVLVEEGNNW